MDKTTPLNILVVEDHLGDYILIKDYLQEIHTDICIVKASSFLEAKDHLLKYHTYDAILLDLSLPDSGDNELLVREIISLAGKTPVIVLTGNSNKIFGLKTLSMGISDYLLKDELNAIQLSKSIFYSIERKRIENQLSESEKKYKTLFDHSPLPKFVLELHTLDFLNVNQAAVDLYGFSREEFLTMNVRDLWIKEEAHIFEKNWQKIRGDKFTFAVKHRKKDGEVIFIEVTSNPIKFEGKDARVSLINNVTSQLLAEQALTHSEQRFKALVQEGSDLVMIMDFCGNLSYVSPSSYTVMGVSTESLLRNNFFYLIHQNDRNKVKDCILKLNKQKRIQVPSYRIKTSGKTWRYIETIVTNLIDDPAVNGLVVNSRDITEFINQEKKLLESLQRYDTVAKATSDTITDFDVVNKKMSFNEGIQNMFGYSPLQVKNEGSWWDDKIHPEDILRVKMKTKEVYENKGNQLHIEYRFRCANGKYKYVLDRSYFLKDKLGNPTRIIGSIQDVSEIQNYIKTIEKHNERLREISWTQSHLVRAPLARIMGLIDLLKNQHDTENQSFILENISKSAHELDAIIRKINSKAEGPAEKLH